MAGKLSRQAKAHGPLRFMPSQACHNMEVSMPEVDPESKDDGRKMRAQPERNSTMRRSLSTHYDFWKDALILIDMSVPEKQQDDGEAFVLVEHAMGTHGVTESNISNKRAFFLMLKSYIGTSILILPRAFRDGGLVPSTFMLTTAGLLSIPCLVLMGKVAEYVGTNTYQHIVTAIYGRRWGDFVAILLVLSQLSCCVMNFAFLSQTLQKVMLYTSDCNEWIENGENWLFILFVVPILLTPIVLIRKLHRLVLPVLFSDVTILLGIVVMSVHASYLLKTRGVGFNIKRYEGDDIMVSVGTDIFTFESAVVTVLPIRSLMRCPQDFPKILALAICARMVVYLGFASLQYVTYGEKIHPTAILNMPDNPASMVLCVPYMVAISIMFPQVFHPATRVLEDWLGMPVGSGKHDFRVKMKKNVFRFVLMFAMAGVAITVSYRLEVFTAICGGVLLIPLVYIIPCFVYKAMFGDPYRVLTLVPLLCLVALVSVLYQSVNLARNYPNGEDDLKSYCLDEVPLS